MRAEGWDNALVSVRKKETYCLLDCCPKERNMPQAVQPFCLRRGALEEATGGLTTGLWKSFCPGVLSPVEDLYSSQPLPVLRAPGSNSLHTGCHVTPPGWKRSTSSFVLSSGPAACERLPLSPLYLGREARWHYRPLQAHWKIIACMIAIFLTSLWRCSLCLGINGCSILDRGKGSFLSCLGEKDIFLALFI